MHPRTILFFAIPLIGGWSLIMMKHNRKEECVKYKKVETTILQGTIASKGIDSICICKFDPITNELKTLNID
jgi:hypothetical protein